MLLAIDSATYKIGIALYDGTEVLHEAVWQSVNRIAWSCRRPSSRP